MLQSFSDRIRNSTWLGYAIVIAISIPFALWGVQAYFGGADPEVAAEVNGEPIQETQVQQMVSQRRQQLRQRFGGDLPSMFSSAMLREQVLEQLITRELLRQVAADAGLQASEQMIAQRIREQEFFQRDGRFDRDLYQRTLAQAGLCAARSAASPSSGTTARRRPRASRSPRRTSSRTTGTTAMHSSRRIACGWHTSRPISPHCASRSR